MFRKVLPLILLVVASAMANAEKVSGFVSGSPSGKTFTLGAKGGPYKVDASKARVTMKGKFFSVSSLTGGSQVTVEGTKTGKNIMATKVEVGFLRGAKPTTAPAKPPVKGPKPPMKVVKSKMPVAPTTVKTTIKKPSSTAKSKDNTKTKTGGTTKPTTPSAPKTSTGKH